MNSEEKFLFLINGLVGIMKFMILLVLFIGIIVFISEPAAVGRWLREVVQSYWR